MKEPERVYVAACLHVNRPAVQVVTAYVWKTEEADCVPSQVDRAALTIIGPLWSIPSDGPWLPPWTLTV